jgi:hypothetical protein
LYPQRTNRGNDGRVRVVVVAVVVSQEELLVRPALLAPVHGGGTRDCVGLQRQYLIAGDGRRKLIFGYGCG